MAAAGDDPVLRARAVLGGDEKTDRAGTSGLSTCNRVRIDQTCLDRSGGLAPIGLPLFQGVRRAGEAKLSVSDMIVLLCYGG